MRRWDPDLHGPGRLAEGTSGLEAGRARGSERNVKQFCAAKQYMEGGRVMGVAGERLGLVLEASEYSVKDVGFSIKGFTWGQDMKRLTLASV